MSSSDVLTIVGLLVAGLLAVTGWLARKAARHAHDLEAVNRRLQEEIGERKRVEQELVHLAGFPEDNPNPIVELDAQGRISYLNPAARAQYPDLEILQARHPVLAGVPKLIAELQRDGKRVTVRELEHDHRVYAQELFAVPRSNRARLYMVDRTEHKQVERLRDEFVNVVSHELRSPMALIREGVSQVLDGVLGETTEPQRNFLAIVLDNIDRLRRVVDELLDFSKVEAQRLELKRCPTDLVALAEALSQMVAVDARQRGIAVRVTAPQRPVIASVDGDRIAQVFTNLLNNAMKFTTQGWVELAVVDRESEVECRVSDTGLGIAEADLPKVFEKFSQFHEITGTGQRGSGLGLAICRGLVELHGGSIAVTSKPGKGSTFTFRLPRLAPEELFKEYLTSRLRDAGRTGEALSVVAVRVSVVAPQVVVANGDPVASVVHRLCGVAQGSLRRQADHAAEDRDRILIGLPGTTKADAHRVGDRLAQAFDAALAEAGLATSVRLTTVVSAFPDDAQSPQRFLQVVCPSGTRDVSRQVEAR